MGQSKQQAKRGKKPEAEGWQLMAGFKGLPSEQAGSA
jgi:hypothetical protein